MAPDPPRWSDDVRQADWIGPRLAPGAGDYTAAMIVPAGFAAYARVLHPATGPGDRLVRWADVAAWSGLPLRPDARFHSVALPPTAPGGPPPDSAAGPRDGSLSWPDAQVLAAILRDWTATPDDCWFGVWDGYGWQAANALASVTAFRPPGQSPPASAPPRPERVPEPVLAGPRVRLPHRNYLLYAGPVEAAAAVAGLDGAGGQFPNLWWPADRAWCVASEIDLPWTYVGGPRGLIDAILADARIEALPAAPGDPVSRVEDWVAGWVSQLLEDLLARGAAALSTPRGPVTARLRRPAGTRPGDLSLEVTRGDGGTSSSHSVLRGDEDKLRRDVRTCLTLAVLGLAGE